MTSILMPSLSLALPSSVTSCMELLIQAAAPPAVPSAARPPIAPGERALPTSRKCDLACAAKFLALFAACDIFAWKSPMSAVTWALSLPIELAMLFEFAAHEFAAHHGVGDFRFLDR